MGIWTPQFSAPRTTQSGDHTITNCLPSNGWASLLVRFLKLSESPVDCLQILPVFLAILRLLPSSQLRQARYAKRPGIRGALWIDKP